jgi:formylglycine-generating enzyme required for sulfatase activity
MAMRTKHSIFSILWWQATFAVLVALATAAGCNRQPAGSASTPQPIGNTAQRVATPDANPKDITTPGGATMVFIPPGEFLMGSPQNIDTAPVHKVSVGGFYMDKHEVTQELYEKLTDKNPSRRKGPKNPVERVRWREAVAFCNARSIADKLHPCYDLKTWGCDFSADGYRLPTEAEWEYACRGGAAAAYYFGDDPAQLKTHAWFKGNALGQPHTVGQLHANPLGLCDMLGNVWEWCNDWYQVDYYGQSPAADPRGPAQGEKKVLRGGAFSSTADNCTAAARNCDDAGFTDACVASDDCGFRCVKKARDYELGKHADRASTDFTDVRGFAE